MHDLVLKILKMSLYISVAVTSKGLDVMDDSQGQGCKRTHIKLISLGQVGFDGSSKIRGSVVPHPPTTPQHDWHKSRGTQRTHNLCLCFNTLPTYHFRINLFHPVFFIIHTHIQWTFTNSSVNTRGPLILLHFQTKLSSVGQCGESMCPTCTCCKTCVETWNSR